jgi:hypothetical protein
MWKGSEYVCFICDERSVFFCQDWPPQVSICPSCDGVVVLIAYDPVTEYCTYKKLHKD